MKVIRGKTLTAPKVMFYGLAGVGKSTLASQLKNPIFMDFEGGVNYMDVPRTPQIQDMDEFYGYIRELWEKSGDKREYDTIVIDSIDWLVRKAVEKAAGIDRTKDGIMQTLNRSNGGYGNGKQVLENFIRTKLLFSLVELNKKGYGICLLAHADKKNLMDADGVDVEQITPKIDVNTMNVFVEWCDNIFYLKKNAEGERVLVLESDDVALAKNRLGLHGERKLKDIDINELLEGKDNENA